MPPRFNNLVLGGGAVRAAAFLGFAEAAGLAAGGAAPRRIVGVSGGAVAAYVLALGMPVSAAIQIVGRHSGFNAGTAELDLGSLIDDFGITDIRAPMRALLDDLLDAWWSERALLRGDGATEKPRTFADLARHTGKDLIVSAVDVDSMRSVYFGVETTPDVDVHLAICASGAVPLVFCPVAVGGLSCVDGGLLEDVPLGALRLRGAPRVRDTLVLQVRDAKRRGARPAPPGDLLAYGKRILVTLLARGSTQPAEARKRVVSVTIQLVGHEGVMTAGADGAQLYDIYLQGLRAGRTFADGAV